MMVGAVGQLPDIYRLPRRTRKLGATSAFGRQQRPGARSLRDEITGTNIGGVDGVKLRDREGIHA